MTITSLTSLRRVFAISCSVAVLISFASNCSSTNHNHPISVAGDNNVPALPSAVGCYKYNVNSFDHKWSKTDCLSRKETSRLPHLLQLGGGSGVYGITAPCVGPCASNADSMITAGSVSVSFPFAYCYGGSCQYSPIYWETDDVGPLTVPGGGTGRNSFSVQLNTNSFPITCQPGVTPPGQNTCVAGDQGGVQFTYQADPGPVGSGFFGLGSTSALCIQIVDITLQNYSNISCTGVPAPFAGISWSPGTGAGGVLEILGGESNRTLWVMGCLPWVSGAPGQCFGVVEPDLFGLCSDPDSSQCAWQEVSGSLLGYGLGSVATFPPGITMSTSVAAAACSPPPSYVIPYTPFPPPGVGKSPSPFAAIQCPAPGGNPIQDTNGLPDSSSLTLESNNLTPAWAPASNIIQSCMEGACWITYNASN
jgi:hypothetical protein